MAHLKWEKGKSQRILIYPRPHRRPRDVMRE